MTLLYGHADHALKAADVGIVASGTATLEAAMSRCPAPHLLSRESGHRQHRQAQAAAAVCRAPEHPCRSVRRAPNSSRKKPPSPNLARAALNLYDDTVTRRRLEALFAGMAKNAGRRYRDTGRRRRRDGTAHGGDRMLIAGVDEAGRGPLAGPVVAAAVILHPDAAHSGAARFEAAHGTGRASGWRSKSAGMRLHGRWRKATSARSTRSISCRRRCWRCGAP